MPTEPHRVPAPGDHVSIPGYEILGELGRGGMGVVYKARQPRLNRIVALKCILSGGHAGEVDRTRFRTEAEAIARLQHPHIVQVYEIGEQEGTPFIALEFCEGGSLEQKVHGQPLPPDEAARLIEALARAMHHAHEHHVVHRDLKPANVLLTADGQPKITDFGLARKLDEAGCTQSGATMGTPSYMAPEQAGGKTKQVGPAADVYALGAILYELLTGRPPFKASSALDTMMQVVTDEPIPPRQWNRRVPGDLETICLKCLEKDPQRRYASAAALAADCAAFCKGESIQAQPAGVGGRLLRWAQQQPALAATLCGVLVLYGNHLRMLLMRDPDAAALHWFVTAVLLVWTAGACCFQWLVNRPAWRWPATYVWAMMDVLLFTMILLRADGPKSSLIDIYLLLIAGAGLRFRTGLVWLVTGLCIVSYAALQIDALLRRPEKGVKEAAVIIFVLSLGLMGLIVTLLLRRFRLALAREP
jgi:serine/threonine-protein kinase